MTPFHPFFCNKYQPTSSGLWSDSWTEYLKLGLSQKLPVLAPALSAPTRPPSCPLFSSLQAAPPAPPLGALSSGKGSRAGPQMQTLGSSWKCWRLWEEGPARGRKDGGAEGPQAACPQEGICLSFTDSFLSSLLGAEESALDKTQGRVYASLASGYHKLSLDYGEEGGLLPPNTRPPESQGCVSPSFQLHPLFFKQYLLQNHKLGGCSHVQSIFITVREDLGVTDSQKYRVAEHRPECGTL